jgi:hypothetical protein
MKKNNAHKRHLRGSSGSKQPGKRPDDSVMLFQQRNGSNPDLSGWASDNQSSDEQLQAHAPTSLWRDDGGESGEEA